ncbi:excinuclease ABC subunit UvrC [Rubellicoccus peritrichatus]|uniref:Excinuclease ABC subunit UvrC n=1 Tax=Rubellicoccus peritrichatus TaxID=3080537 RepID=A0AAQ3LDI8_9BACT|nr:excinuclease ABC subunit UvrC [Puniceicoccus sp. CR14]WOO41578.1 excinuclease ABC subunit UvrC [Puniceicoccus sp. CR14]
MSESRKASIKEKVRRISSRPGVYLMKDRFGTVLYVGKAKSLKKRVSTYFQPSRKTQIAQPKIIAMIDLVHDIETIEVKSETEALLLEGKLIKEYRPRYNTDFVDNKQFLLVRVDVSSELPRFRLTRNRREDGARYFGPFAHSGLLRRTLAEMRLQFGILLGDAKPEKLSDGRWRLYDDARAEIYRQTEVVTQEEYHTRVEQACAFLDGKSREWLADLKEEMAKSAADQRFERAAELRDIIAALTRTIEPSRRFTRVPKVVSVKANEAVEALKLALEMSEAPLVMECFDISHISGEHVVASMVRFVGGRPDKQGYRRFRIRSFIGNDDFRAMEEVVGRRYRRLHEEGRPFPDLIVIDGGLGQVRAAQKAFLVLDLIPPTLIGLAKREETVVFPDEREPVQMQRHDPGLQLLQRIRDEAHRFANSFNADLRSKKIRESVLDDFDGLGPVKRRALMEKFRSVEKLKHASLDELKQVEGIGPKTAESLKAFLDRL